MHLRADALAGAAEWICTAESTARDYDSGLVATVGQSRKSRRTPGM